MNAGKLLIMLIFIMLIVWYTAIWSMIIPHIRADTDLTDFTVETIQNGGDCLRKSQADDRLLVRYVIKIHGTDHVIESRMASDSPYIVHLGQFVDIPTLERGLFDMCEQESRSMVVPPLLGYGVTDSQTKQGNPVPGNSTLQYDVTLVKIFSREESKPSKDTRNEVKSTEEDEGREGGAESAGTEGAQDGTRDPEGGTPMSEEDDVKAKDKKIVENIMADAMNKVFPEKESTGKSGGLADMLGGMFGGSGGGGMAGLMGKLAGAMGSGGAGGEGEGMGGLVSKLAGAMGGGGAGGMEGLMGQLAGAMGNGGEGGMDGLMSQLAGAMGKEGEGGMEGLMGKLSGLMGEGAGGKGGLEGIMGLMGQLGGGDGGLPLGKISDVMSKMMKRREERKNRRKTEL